MVLQCFGVNNVVFLGNLKVGCWINYKLIKLNTNA